ncbi:Succinate dehydrogenase assembly factor 4, mitochondrial [Mycena venus]|uniref:Succinate dehydrogenase assembly factor 4, mitochondrial n=1 Tax=Mycena venus TaxID=2733690 RepID=A0A8H6YNY7_9AGAR|nr:Succinate dehydrogenase assembly factor 4, mitochondrial [Mycena venus]
MFTRRLLPVLRRYSSLNRPSPIPLPREQQREFEQLQRAAQTPLAANNTPDDDLQLHPDAREPLRAEFEGDVNPKTGEQGGPKREPKRRFNQNVPKRAPSLFHRLIPRDTVVGATPRPRRAKGRE